MSEIKLFSYFRSSCSYRVRIALAHKGLEYEYAPVHLLNDGGEQNHESYQKLNPTGLVPLLVHGDKHLSESMAIMNYLDAIVPEKPLFPADPWAKSQVIALCEIINSGLQPLQNLGVIQEMKKQFGASSEQIQAWCRFWITKRFKSLEAHLEKTASDFCFGSEISAVEMFLIPQVYNAHRFRVDMNQFPLISKIDKKCSDLEAFKKAHPHRQPDTPAELQE